MIPMSDSPDPKIHQVLPPPAVPLAEIIRASDAALPGVAAGPVREIGGRREGLDPTRYGDWEKNGRCIDF